jgi:hypothetical protein
MNRNRTRRRERVDRPRVIGTLSERAALITGASNVLSAMTASRLFEESDLTSLETVILGFLREPAPCLLGFCSYSNNHRNATNAGERTWRILVKRSLIHSQDGELAATLYHEFLHSILGYDEGHGALFQKYEGLWPYVKSEMVR